MCRNRSVWHDRLCLSLCFRALHQGAGGCCCGHIPELHPSVGYSYGFTLRECASAADHLLQRHPVDIVHHIIGCAVFLKKQTMPGCFISHWTLASVMNFARNLSNNGFFDWVPMLIVPVASLRLQKSRTKNSLMATRVSAAIGTTETSA